MYKNSYFYFVMDLQSFIHIISHHYVPSMNKLQPRLEDGDVQNVNEVTEVVGQQPIINVVWRLVGKGPANWDEPHIPIPCQTDQQHPQHIQEVWGNRQTRRGINNIYKEKGETGIMQHLLVGEHQLHFMPENDGEKTKMAQ